MIAIVCVAFVFNPFSVLFSFSSFSVGFLFPCLIIFILISFPSFLLFFPSIIYPSSSLSFPFLLFFFLSSFSCHHFCFPLAFTCIYFRSTNQLALFIPALHHQSNFLPFPLFPSRLLRPLSLRHFFHSVPLLPHPSLSTPLTLTQANLFPSHLSFSLLL